MGRAAPFSQSKSDKRSDTSARYERAITSLLNTFCCDRGKTSVVAGALVQIIFIEKFAGALLLHFGLHKDAYKTNDGLMLHTNH